MKKSVESVCPSTNNWTGTWKHDEITCHILTSTGIYVPDRMGAELKLVWDHLSTRSPMCRICSWYGIP
jgi:hypothetical protein